MSVAPAAPKQKRASKAQAITQGDAVRSTLFNYVVSLADDALVLGHRLSEWSGRGPMLEEDIALSNLGLDLIGQARLLYAYAGEVEGKGRGEDDLAYLRDEFAYANLLLVEQPNGDFAATMVRHLLYAAFMHPYLQAMQTSADARLAEIAAKAVKEMAYHVRHAAEWVIRLGDGTEESHAPRRCGAGRVVDVHGRAVRDDGRRARAGRPRALPSTVRRSSPVWDATVDRVLAEATLKRPSDRWMQGGGRSGRHSEHLGHLLAEMQVLHRAHPGATW